jgi:hypothetical protein
MAINLNKLGVPTNGETTNQGLLMPKLQYRFRVNFFNFGISNRTTELTKQVMTATRPSPDFDEITLDVYNSRIKLAGKPKWNPISIVLRDEVTGVVSGIVGEQLQKQFDFFEQASAFSGIDYKFTTQIELLDGGNGTHTPRVLETFDLYGCYLQKVEYKGGDYKESTPLDITLTIVYDNAIQIGPYGGVGDNLVAFDAAKRGDVATGA